MNEEIIKEPVVAVQIGVVLNAEDDVNELLNEAKVTALCECMDGLTADELDGVSLITITFDHVFHPEKREYVISGNMYYEGENTDESNA